MKARLIWPLAVAVPALAQVGGEATWLWNVTTEDGDAIVEPGETATVTLSIDMTPDVNFPNGPVMGFGAAFFDTLAGNGAANGQILGWTVLNNLDALIGDQTETDGLSLFGAAAGQIPFTGVFTDADPIDVLEFTWTTMDYSNYAVAYETATYIQDDPPTMHVIYVWEGDEDDYDPFVWPISEAAISFNVVPAPSVLVPVAIGCMTMSRRSRSLRRENA